MNVAVFYPSQSYSDTVAKDSAKGITSHVMSSFPVVNLPPYSRNKREDFMRLIRDETIDLLMAWRGGRVADNGDEKRSSIQLVKDLSDCDWTEIARSGKPIVGLSDVTYLLSALLEHEINCYYGPNYHSSLFNTRGDKDAITTMIDYLNMALSGDYYVIDFNDARLTKAGGNKPWCLKSGIAEGKLTGGNLDTLYEVLKRRRDLQPDPNEQYILFLEENDPYYAGTDNDESMFDCVCECTDLKHNFKSE